MPVGDIVTFYEDGIWANWVEGSEEVFGRSSSKAEAVRAGRARAQVAHVEHRIEDDESGTR